MTEKVLTKNLPLSLNSASISSMNMIEGPFKKANSKRTLTSFSESPRHLLARLQNKDLF